MPSDYGKDVAALMRRLRRDHGCTVGKTGGDHWRVTGPNGAAITTSQTPHSPHAIRRIRADLKRHLGIVL